MSEAKETINAVDVAKRLKYEYYSYIAPLYADWRNGMKFKQEVEMTIDNHVKALLKYCIMIEWNEGIIICEREIARRGLHVEDNEERFDL